MRAALFALASQSAKAVSVTYSAFERRAHAGYREAKHLTGTVFRRGWRPLIPWVAVFIFAGLGWRIVNGLPIPGVVELLGVLGPLTIPTALAQWTRYSETIRGVANATGVFNSPGAAAGH
jgi:hypothetical protein